MHDFPPAPEPASFAAAWAGADLGRSVRLLQRLALAFGAALLVIAAFLFAAPSLPAVAEARTSGLAGLALAALLLPLAGLIATLPLAAARLDCLAYHRHKLPEWLRLRPIEPALRLALLARRPQGTIIPVLCAGALASLWLLRPGAAGGSPQVALALGAGAVVLGFPLLVMQRIMGAVTRARLAEAEGLAALLHVPVIVVPLAGVIEIAAAQGFGPARIGLPVLSAFVALGAAELGLRALANWFLPPPAPEAARAAVDCLAARLLLDGSSGGSLATPIRTQLGIDFSRSWALRYARAAAAPVGLALALIAWALTGVALIPLDQRGVYERFGAPVAVWQPGAHLGLPWPLGRVRPVELGVVHAMALGGGETPDPNATAEGRAPASADRLWDKVHPAETSYLIASVTAAGGQSFQSVDADVKVLYRTGLDDAAALRAAYGVASAEALVRSETGRLLARLFAGRVLTDVVGADRESLAERIRQALQAELDQRRSGIETLGVVIEAIHPPLAAAQAYHNVQAVEIIANTAIATERGRAQAAAAAARQRSTDLLDAAHGASAETVTEASARLREFTADAAAAKLGGPAFLMERYFGNLRAALAKAPLVVTDHRLDGASAPLIDLRSFGAPASRSADED